MPEIDYFQIKIEEIPGISLNLSLNLNLAILKMKDTGSGKIFAIDIACKYGRKKGETMIY